MSTTFMNSPRYLFTSESVSEGHPDKMCDQISDAVLDAILAEDPLARVACEVATTTGLVVVMGEITTRAYVDIDSIVRATIRDIGYTQSDYGFDAETCGVLISIKEQSDDIKQGVDTALEAREGGLAEAGVDATGAGDQGMMIGFACDETEELMPLSASLSHGLMRRLAAARKSGEIAWLRPDAKCQVTVEYTHGRPTRADTIVLSTQHAPEISPIRDPLPDHRFHQTRRRLRQVDRRAHHLPYQSHGSIRHWRSLGGRRFDRAQDHGRYLRRRRPAWRRRFLGQRRDKGGSQRGVYGALRRQEHRQSRDSPIALSFRSLTPSAKRSRHRCRSRPLARAGLATMTRLAR